ncbi:nuclear transport factor 2 family protein [Flavobacterium sp. NRK1]|uniref:nuclear transport factor 2 family protein n=1 Tax=Flavobacterium sp. NRK1 TaxID=2954929 RepID=UPI0020933F7B|nr:nuclear transport factor 2 family protein [Flavobacterium sp. NRK1]MCO6149280.1 nuclear transport factor 2 family protein [Flavobacterium sp. NRK1]
MKRTMLCLLLMFTFCVNAQDTEIKKTIAIFFEGLHTSDTLKIKSVCSKNMILQSISENEHGVKLITEDLNEFYKMISEIPSDIKVEERLLNYRIQIDGSMANAWTPYEFYIKGKLSHKGVNSFQLFKDDGIWKIIYIIDTRRK